MINPKTDCLLNCGCVWNDNALPVKLAESVMCRKHGAALVILIGINDYQVHCQNCSYHANAKKLTAEMRAISHRRRRKSHTVVVTRPDGEVHHTYKPDHVAEPPLPL